jgi:homoserine O-acetyltransferase
MTQKEDDEKKITSFKASSYQAYQGDKLVRRFNPYSYWSLLQLADTHNVGRGRDGVVNALKEIKSKTLCVGIKSDILYPVDEQKFVAANINNAEYVEIESFYGHDGFLIETKIVTDVIRKFWEKTSNLKK